MEAYLGALHEAQKAHEGSRMQHTLETRNAAVIEAVKAGATTQQLRKALRRSYTQALHIVGSAFVNKYRSRV